jgi:hypothetical protein
VKKVIAYSVLALGAWLAVTTSWALVSYATGVPGPAAVTSGALGIGAEVVGAVDAPFPFSKAQRVAIRQLHRSQHFVERINRVPERAVHRFLDRIGIQHAHAHEVFAIGVAPRPELAHRHLDRVRIRAPRVRVVVPSQAVAGEIATAMEDARASLAVELARAQAELLAARTEIEAWDHEVLSDEMLRELRAVDLDGIRLELDAELEALSEELQRLELDLDFEFRAGDIDARRSDLMRFRRELEEAAEAEPVVVPVADEMTN